MLLYDIIDPMFGISAMSVKSEIDKLPKGSELRLRINSPGGDVFDGMAIYNLLASSQLRITTYIDGIAASIASIIALAGDTVLSGDGAVYMIHEPWTITVGNRDEHKETIKLLTTVNENGADLYTKNSKSTKEQILKWLSAETYMTAQEAIDRGFADAFIDGSKPVPQKKMSLTEYAELKLKLIANR
jgi:ATP-dependent Clp protease protease subunit